VTRRLAPAKINLALVVGPRRDDGKHELVTVYERIDLADDVTLEAADGLSVEGFPDDTIVRSALAALAEVTQTAPRWRVKLEKRIPVAAGLGGGSSDAASALLLANETLEEPLSGDSLHAVAAAIGSDVPFFLLPGPQLGQADGAKLTQLDLPRDYCVLVLLPDGATKRSTADVYAAFDATGGGRDYAHRRAALLETLGAVKRPGDLAALPRNDLAASPLSAVVEQAGAFRADVSGSGPALYGLFEEVRLARSAAAELAHLGRVWIAFPSWYG
jgi:4-diphosphocytidyl-2-C-methyl-D-erythritol kinase